MLFVVSCRHDGPQERRSEIPPHRTYPSRSKTPDPRRVEYTHNGPWYNGDSFLSYEDPLALAACWSNYYNNELRDVTGELWENYHFVGNTGRISVFTTKPYSEAFNTQRIDYEGFPQYWSQNAAYEPLLYCGFCNLYDRYHEHGHDDDPPAFDPYEGYPSGYDTD